jgi:MOSC domain-containing protein YiiM
MAHLLSVNVGTPREVPLPGGSVGTAIWKSPVAGRVALRRHNLDGDRQADLRVHGGPWKAVYLYPSEHYSYWAGELPDAELPHGAFGENLTSAGLLEDAVRIGDRFRIGSVVLQATQPRMPCYKLNVRFDRADMVRRFWASGRSGIYFSVVEEGEIGAGDEIEQAGPGPEEITVADVVRLFKGEETDPEKLRRAMRSPLHGSWKEELDGRFRG